MLYEKDYHEFEDPYVDENGKQWYGFCSFQIEYEMCEDFIDYPNGMVRRIEDPLIKDFAISNLSLSSIDGSEVVEEVPANSDLFIFFRNKFDPEDYKDFLS